MGKTAREKLRDADQLDETARRIAKRDPDSAAELRDLAHKRRKAAIRQLRRRPKRASRGARASAIRVMEGR